jgi:hypothetical protein
MKILALCLSIALITGCRSKQDCDDHDFTYAFKAFVTFTENAYWVYTDTLSGITDTLVLTDQAITFEDECSGTAVPEGVIKQTFTSSYFHDSIAVTAEARASQNRYNGHVVLGTFFESGTHYDSLEVLGTWYRNVYECVLGGDKYYWAVRVGVIKKLITFPAGSSNVYLFQLSSYDLIP